MMRPIPRTRIKICCISSEAEARLAVRHGASALGLVSQMPSGPGVIPEALIAEIAAAVPPGIATFLLTGHQDADAIIDQHRRCRTTTIQLCDAVTPTAYETIREALPGTGIVQVIHVAGEESVAKALTASRFADALLLDSGRPELATKELGGTDRVHDWEISRRIVAESRIAVYLAGGLNAANVGGAIGTAAPFGVDLCSGVRTGGRLDEDKLTDFVEAVLDTS